MVPVCALKVRDVGASDAAGAGAAVPVPVRATECGEPVALSVTVIAAVKVATEAGVKVTEIEQLAFAARELPQVFVWAKSAAPVPVMAMLLMLSAALPVFLSVAI